MAVDFSTKRVAEVADLPIKNPDASPMVDDDGVAVTATVFGPGTKIWQVAHAAMRRKAIKRSREAKGKYEASLDNEIEDQIEFLVTITKRFNNFANPDGVGDKELVEQVYNDLRLGFIRDHMLEDTESWENFMKASQSS
jgi:hypothetical protein